MGMSRMAASQWIAAKAMLVKRVKIRLLIHLWKILMFVDVAQFN
jgi:hypothetical protein